MVSSGKNKLWKNKSCPLTYLSCKISRLFIYIMICLFLSFGFGFSEQETSPEGSGENMARYVQMLAPVENELVYGKKPDIECRINVPYIKESLYVQLDYTDISALININSAGFKFSPVQVLQPGNHQLTVSFTTQTGEQAMEQFQFTSRHSKIFKTAYSKNIISAGYTKIIKKYQDAEDRRISRWNAEVNLGTENLLAQGPWSFRFNANGRYHDEQFPPVEPLEDKLELVNFLFAGEYQKEKYMAGAEVGDLLINESRNSVNNLSRRGGRLYARYGAAGVSGFVVRSDQIYGSDGNFGLGLDNEDHLIGVTGDVDLLKNRANIKALYISGGTLPDNESFGQWDISGGTKGNVKGVIVTTDFFQHKLATSFEFDRSYYDFDTLDNLDAEHDKAYLLKADGILGKFSYSVEYEYTGPYYQVPCSNVRNDYKGYTLKGNLTFEEHTFGAMYSVHNNDVDHDSLFGRTDYTDYVFDYALNMFAALPMTFQWFRNIEKNRVALLDSYTDTYSSTISFIKDAYNVVFTPFYSKTNDRTDADLDTSNLSLTLSASYFNNLFSIQPSMGFNRYKDLVTGVYSDTDSYSLTLTANILKGISINNTCNFSNTEASDKSIDQTYYSDDFQITYAYPGRIRGVFSPKASLGATYGKTKDIIMDTRTEETIVYITLSGDFILSF